MQTFLLLLTFITINVFASPESVLVVGEDYIFQKMPGAGEKNIQQIRPVSNAFDAETCTLWMTDSKTESLIQFDKALNPTSYGKVYRILSQPKNGKFLVVIEGRRIALVDPKGNLSPLGERDWAENAVSVELTKNGAWSLNVTPKKNTLDLVKLDADFKPIQTIGLYSGPDLWNVPKLIVDEDRGKIWVGYSATVPQHTYTPILERHDLDGKLLHKQVWKDRGLLFDVSLETDGSALISRDIPSNSGFTVPVYSYLERVSDSGLSNQVYDADVNQVIDSIACLDDQVFLAERGLLSGSMSKLRVWNRKIGDAAKDLALLPSPAVKIYTCNH